MLPTKIYRFSSNSSFNANVQIGKHKGLQMVFHNAYTSLNVYNKRNNYLMEMIQNKNTECNHLHSELVTVKTYEL